MQCHEEAEHFIKQLADQVSALPYGDLDTAQLLRSRIQVRLLELDREDASPICTPWPQQSFENAFLTLEDAYRPVAPPHLMDLPEDDPLFRPVTTYEMVEQCHEYVCHYFGYRLFRWSLAAKRRWDWKSYEDSVGAPLAEC